MLTLAEIRQKLSDRNLRVIAERTGINYQTLWRIMKKPGHSPSLSTVERLSDYLTTT